MGVIYGIVNIVIAVWFYASASSVNKRAVLWAVIGALAFLAFKFLGYTMIALIQESAVDANLGSLMEKGYIPSEKSADLIVKETADEQSAALGFFYEFFPLVMALVGVVYIRAKFILKMSFTESLKHKTPLMLEYEGTSDDDKYQQGRGLMQALSGFFHWGKKQKNS